jgi:hypothetical protein
MKNQLRKVEYYTKTTIPSLTEQHYSSDREACLPAGTKKKIIAMSSVNHRHNF